MKKIYLRLLYHFILSYLYCSIFISFLDSFTYCFFRDDFFHKEQKHLSPNRHDRFSRYAYNAIRLELKLNMLYLSL